MSHHKVASKQRQDIYEQGLKDPRNKGNWGLGVESEGTVYACALLSCTSKHVCPSSREKVIQFLFCPLYLIPNEQSWLR